MFRRSLTSTERRDPLDVLLLWKGLWIINRPIIQFILLLKNTLRKLMKKKLLVGQDKQKTHQNIRYLLFLSNLNIYMVRMISLKKN